MRIFSRLYELFEDWRFLFLREGFSAITAIGLEVARLPYRNLEFILLERSLDETLPDYQPKIDLEIRSFTKADLDLVRDIDRPSEASQCERRLACGHIGLAAFHQNQLAGYGWGCTEVNRDIDKVQILLKPGDFLCTDVFTNPVFRGNGIHTALSIARFRKFRDLGYRNAVCYIESKNAPSLAVWQRKLGGRINGKIDFLRIGPWYRVRYHSIH